MDSFPWGQSCLRLKFVGLSPCRIKLWDLTSSPFVSLFLHFSHPQRFISLSNIDCKISHHNIDTERIWRLQRGRDTREKLDFLRIKIKHSFWASYQFSEILQVFFSCYEWLPRSIRISANPGFTNLCRMREWALMKDDTFNSCEWRTKSARLPKRPLQNHKACYGEKEGREFLAAGGGKDEERLTATRAKEPKRDRHQRSDIG